MKLKPITIDGVKYLPVMPKFRHNGSAKCNGCVFYNKSSQSHEQCAKASKLVSLQIGSACKDLGDQKFANIAAVWLPESKSALVQHVEYLLS